METRNGPTPGWDRDVRSPRPPRSQVPTVANRLARIIMALDSFGTRDQLTVDDTSYQIYRLDRIDGSNGCPTA